jgi:hypothetical protein
MEWIKLIPEELLTWIVKGLIGNIHIIGWAIFITVAGLVFFYRYYIIPLTIPSLRSTSNRNIIIRGLCDICKILGSRYFAQWIIYDGKHIMWEDIYTLPINYDFPVSIKMSNPMYTDIHSVDDNTRKMINSMTEGASHYLNKKIAESRGCSMIDAIYSQTILKIDHSFIVPVKRSDKVIFLFLVCITGDIDVLESSIETRLVNLGEIDKNLYIKKGDLTC